jgi:y4mF family transcriptional regulator
MEKHAACTSTQALGAALRKERKKHKLTQADVAFAAGVGIRFLSDLESGKPTVQLEKVLQVVAVLGGALLLRWNSDRS